jgi:serine/threonine-protein kinase
LSGTARERFARERNILARLQHPHIAHLFDDGLTADGRPYLALEYIEGEPITHWCRRRRASIEQRLDLLEQVMAAVEYAHSRLVVHRDLKPSNVLVTADGTVNLMRLCKRLYTCSSNVLVTADGTVKLLDFGIAKMLAADDPVSTPDTLTRAGQHMATPGYSAPEQITGEAVTTRADVYALGVMLYELLCGRRPFPDHGRTDAAGEPAPLCSSLIGPEFTETMGGARTATLRKAVRGDLDAILAKAVDVSPDRRYASVEALTADIARHRTHRPIHAQRISSWALAAKFLRRHRVGASLVSTLLVMIFLALGLVAWQAKEAAQQARRAEAAKAFLVDIFSASDPRVASDKPRGTITARELLDLGAQRIEREFADDPATEIDLLGTVANIYRELGATDQASRLTERKVALAKQFYGELSEPVLDTAVQSAGFSCSDQRDDCATLQRVADDLLDRAGRNDSTLRAEWWVNEGLRLRSDAEQALPRRAAFEKAVAMYAQNGPRDPGQVTAITELATDFQAHGDYKRTIELDEQALRLAANLPRRNDAETQTIYGNMALAYQQSGDMINASVASDKAADIAERTSGADFVTLWETRGNAARSRHLGGDREAADAAFEALMTHLPPLTVQSTSASVVRELYGERLATEGRPALAVPLIESAEREFVEHPRDEFDVRRARLRLGDALDRLGRHAEARVKLSSALNDYVAHSSPGDQPLLVARERWGRFLLDRGEIDAAAGQFEEIIRQANQRQLSHIALAHGDLARVALLHKDHERALAESATALDLWQHKQGFYDVRMEPYLQRIRADALAASGQHDLAQQLEDSAWVASQKYDAPESPTRRHRTM